MTTQLAVRLDDDLLALVDEVAAMDNLTRTALVREGLVMACRARKLAHDPLADLIAAGVVIPAKNPDAPWPTPVKQPPGSPTSEEILDYMRQDRI